MNIRLKWLRDKLNALNIQGMIVSNPLSIKYLTNIDAEGELLITRKENVFITDGRYIEEVNTSLTIDDGVVVYDRRNMMKEDYENYFIFCETVGFEEGYVTFEKYKYMKQLYRVNDLVETEHIIEKQRVIKDDDEIKNIKKACELTDKCFSHIIKYIKKGMTERQVSNEIERYFKQNGADGLAFDTIVASGENSSKPHSSVTNRRIMPGYVILLDFGCKYNGYCSDMTRTIFMNKVPERVKQVYDLVLRNQENFIKEVKENANIKTLTKMIENDFRIYEYDLIHALGHGVGMEVHELPFLSSKKDNMLKENMVIAVEPGIYIPGKFGVRIEDTILVTKNGCIKLNNSEKNYIIIS